MPASAKALALLHRRARCERMRCAAVLAGATKKIRAEEVRRAHIGTALERALASGGRIDALRLAPDWPEEARRQIKASTARRDGLENERFAACDALRDAHADEIRYRTLVERALHREEAEAQARADARSEDHVQAQAIRRRSPEAS